MCLYICILLAILITERTQQRPIPTMCTLGRFPNRRTSPKVRKHELCPKSALELAVDARSNFV